MISITNEDNKQWRIKTFAVTKIIIEWGESAKI